MGSPHFTIKRPVNETELEYRPGSPERIEVQVKIEEFMSEIIEVPVIIGGKEVFTGNTIDVTIPHNHRHVIARAHLADKETLESAIEAAMKAKDSYIELTHGDRAAFMMRAGDLLHGPWRPILTAATMLGISKTVHQAETDIAELIDMFRFNRYYLSEIFLEQPLQADGMYNRLDYRPLDGFVLAITPFNFTSIAGNLPTTPALMGNTVLWKPTTSALFNAYHVMRLLQEAGFPDGVISFIPSRGPVIERTVIPHPDLGGIHFTGSTQTMTNLWKRVAENIESYRQYPRLVGETGGKNFVIVHSSAGVDPVVTALIRGAFEYQGQKCSAASRAYIPRSLWPGIREKMVSELSTVTLGDPSLFSDFMSAIINAPQYRRVVEYIEYGRQNSELVHGGKYDDSTGYFIHPTVFRTHNPRDRLMTEEIFGPVLTVYVYEDEKYAEALRLCDETSPYGLTGSVFADDRDAINQAEKALRFAAGNFYINDKPTGSMVAQQPFGGSRKSGTNDKAAYKSNLLRWTSLRAIKESFTQPTDYRRPFMERKKVEMP